MKIEKPDWHKLTNFNTSGEALSVAQIQWLDEMWQAIVESAYDEQQVTIQALSKNNLELGAKYNKAVEALKKSCWCGSRPLNELCDGCETLKEMGEL